MSLLSFTALINEEWSVAFFQFSIYRSLLLLYQEYCCIIVRQLLRKHYFLAGIICYRLNLIVPGFRLVV